MKRLYLPALILALSTAVAACSSVKLWGQQEPAPAPVEKKETVDLQTVPFVAGRSSVTVERMAQKHNCTGGQGAGLLTKPGPVEIYRMACSEGGVFMARCELRQCAALGNKAE